MNENCSGSRVVISKEVHRLHCGVSPSWPLLSPGKCSTGAEGWSQGWVPDPHPCGVDWDMVEAEQNEKLLENSEQRGREGVECGWALISQSGLSSKNPN